MACDERWLEILSAWQDGEARDDEILRARAHLPGCRACAATRAGFQRLHARFDGLRWDGAGEHRPLRGLALTPPAGRQPREVRLRLGAGLAIAAGLALLAWMRSPGGPPVADEVEARHRTAFSRPTPCDFTSSDPSAVRSWLAANVGYEVEVPVIPDAQLLGARRCNVRGGLTASVLYRRGDEPLSIFVLRKGAPGEAETARLASSRTGCTVARLGTAVCARPGRMAVAETPATALAALESF